MNRVDVYRSAKAPVREFTRSHWNSAPFLPAARLAQRYLRIWSNNNHNLAVNGEAEVLRRLSKFDFKTMVDVGAHSGAWTDQALEHHHEARIHCFEADPELATALEEKYRNEPRVVANSAGLADAAGTKVLYVNEKERTISSMIEVPGSVHTAVEVLVLRGDEYVTGAEVDTIDYLKIDTEGFDFLVLQGFSSMFGPSIRVIQFEYNEWNIQSRRLLADFYELLEPHGYRLGKVHPNGVAFSAHSPQEENWIGPAVVAVQESYPELMRAVSTASPRWGG